MKFIRALLDRLPGVDDLLSHPTETMVAVCVGTLILFVVAVSL